MKKKLIYIAGLCLSLACLPACKEYLDQNPLDSPTTGNFFNTEQEMNVALTGIYNSLNWDGGSVPYQQLFDHWTDIGLERTPGLAEGTYDVGNGSVSAIWNYAYVTIQRANTMLEGMERGKDKVNEANYNRMRAEARALRAWAYYHLAFMYGDVPLITKPLAGEEFYTQTTTPKSDIVKFLYQELDEAAAALSWDPKDRGRMSKAIALGLKARIALYDGNFQEAASAAKQVIDNAKLNLNPKFQDLFTRAGQAPNSGKEIMFELLYSDAAQFPRTYVPLGQGSRNLGGQSGKFPNQRLVDMFEARDGKRIDESAVYNPAQPSRNRDPRLKYTVIMQGDTITHYNTGGPVTAVYEIYNDNTSFFNAARNVWETRTNNDKSNAFGPVKNGVGYLWAKYTFNNEDLFNSKVSWIFMRYAEILLTYAEAKIELNQLDAGVVDAINKVRQRAGMPVVDAAIAGNPDKMRQLVRRERTVELALEGFRWFDIRRWKIAELVMPGRVYGAPLSPTVVAATPNFKTNAVTDLNNIPDYANSASTRFVRDNRFFQPKHYLFPIPQRERDLNKTLSQNPLWQ